MAETPGKWQEYQPGVIWVREYLIRFFGMVTDTNTISPGAKLMIPD